MTQVDGEFKCPDDQSYNRAKAIGDALSELMPHEAFARIAWRLSKLGVELRSHFEVSL